MSRPHFILIFILAALSCSGLPALKQNPAVSNAATCESCATTSIARPMRFVHSIEATLKGNRKAFIIGITVANPSKRTLDSAIMSLEGLVLFQARYDKKVTVSRAVDLFSSPEFSDAMMRDIALILFAPEIAMTASGAVRGAPVCRYESESETIDIVSENKSWKKKLYREGKCVRIVSASSINPQGFPEEIELTASGDFSYSLYLKLISAEEVGI